MEKNMNSIKALTFIGLTIFLSGRTYGQTLTIGANCTNSNNTNQILSVVFDSESRRLTIYLKDISDIFDHDSLVSGPILNPTQFEDRRNPIEVVSVHDQTVRNVIFSTKNTVLLSSPQGKTAYFCQAYFPGQLGMNY